MRLRVFLLALIVSCMVTAGTAKASVRASGLQCTSVGAATVTTSADGKHWFCSNFKVSGLDGADIQLSGLDGHQIQCATPWSSSDAGTECRFSWGVSNPGSGGTGSESQGRAGLKRTTEGVEWLCDLSGMSSSSSMTVLLYLQDALVSSLSCPSSSTFELQSPPAVATKIPDVTFELDRSSHRCLSSMSLQSPALFVFGGVSLQVDRVVCVADVDGDGALDLCSVRCISPPSSSVQSLDFSSMSCVLYGASLTFTGLDLDVDAASELSHVHSNPLYSEQSMSGENPLFEQIYGHGGGGGGGAGKVAVQDLSVTRRCSLQGLDFSRTNPFSLDPATDDGASLEYTLLGTGGCSPTGVLASCKVSVQDLHLRASASFAGMCADQESVIVKSGGRSAGRFALELDGVVDVSAPPGGPRQSAGRWLEVDIRSPAGSGNLVAPSPGRRSGSSGRTSASGGNVPTLSISGGSRVNCDVAFLDSRVFIIGGLPVTGDELIFSGQCTSGTCGAITVTGNNFSLGRCSSGSCSGGSTSLDLESVISRGFDQVLADIPPTAALSSTHPLVDVPVFFDRVDTTPVRGYSVTVALSPGLHLASPVVESDYLSRSGLTQMFVTNNPDGSFTVDCALLGPGCGPTTSGRLFTLPVSLDAAVPVASNTGYVDISVSVAADCNAGPVPADPGGRSYLLIDTSAPSAPTLSVAQVKTGNDASGTTRVSYQLGSLAVEDSYELYRAPFGNYPEYGTGASPGSVPPMPSYPPTGKWSRTNGTCTLSAIGTEQCDDQVSERDVYYYVAFAVDRAGNVSPPSSMTHGVLNYHIGDVAGGGSACSGDNRVTTADISALGASYGTSLPVGSSLECLDVGPTDDGTIDGRPLADHKLSFKDLILYAINYSLVSLPASAPRMVAGTSDAVRLRVPPLPVVGQTFEVALEMSGAGDVQGLSTQLAFDPAVVEPLGATAGELLSHQGREGVVLSSQPGDVDAVLLGVGGGIAGEGELARVTFRVKGEGDPGLGIASVDARDAQNRTLAMGGVGVPGVTPAHTALRMAFPNPFERSTTVVLSLSQGGPASVRVFDVAGRTVRTLLEGVQPAGERVLAWDGRDDGGTALSAGVYLLRLDAGGHSETRSVRLVK